MIIIHGRANFSLLATVELSLANRRDGEGGEDHRVDGSGAGQSELQGHGALQRVSEPDPADRRVEDQTRKSKMDMQAPALAVDCFI